MSVTSRRILLAAVPHLPAMLPAAVLLVGAGDRLPDPIASHFGITGVADGFADRWVIVAVQLGLGLLLTVLFAFTARNGRGSAIALGSGDHSRFVVGAAWGIAAFLGVLLYITAAVILDLGDAAASTLPAWWFPAELARGLVDAARRIGMAEEELLALVRDAAR